MIPFFTWTPGRVRGFLPRGTRARASFFGHGHHLVPTLAGPWKRKKKEWDTFYLKIGSRAPLRPVTRNWWPLRSPLAKLASSPILGRLSPALLIRERRTGGGRRIPLLFEGQPKIVGCLPTRLMGNSRPTPFFYLLLHVIEVDGSCGPSHPWRPFPSRRLSYCASIVDNSGQHPALSLSAFIFFPPFGDRLWNSRREDP